MRVLEVRNVSEALPAGVRLLLKEGQPAESRNGAVLRAPFPVTTLYHRPTERVLFHPERDANPFFHFFESLWMLAGRDDVKFPASFAGNIKRYSDDGKTLHGAYGRRWRKHFSLDQLDAIVEELSGNHDSRRAVLQMWDPRVDLGKAGADIPCNTSVYFSVRKPPSGHYLEMMVSCRSNDIVWGAYGANAVHFSYLQEYMAARLGLAVGRYWQVSYDFHAYPDVFDKVAALGLLGSDDIEKSDPYATGRVAPYPIISSGTRWKEWHEDLAIFIEEGPIVGFREKFFRRVVTPLYNAHRAYSNSGDADRYDKAVEILQRCDATDWRAAAVEWIERRRPSTGGKARG